MVSTVADEIAERDVSESKATVSVTNGSVGLFVGLVVGTWCWMQHPA
tara:strand:+ start:437 stop:577 length:141 start_codon:yes stop_codon:yes gene_type:complete